MKRRPLSTSPLRRVPLWTASTSSCTDPSCHGGPHWITTIGGQRREWDAEISEQKPDDRIAWTSRAGVYNAGVVTFHRLDDKHTKVMLRLAFEPSGFVESVGDKLGFVSRSVGADLERFKEFIESHGAPTGAWRGQIRHDRN